jgi:hypothetical protein
MEVLEVEYKHCERDGGETSLWSGERIDKEVTASKHMEQ